MYPTVPPDYTYTLYGKINGGVEAIRPLSVIQYVNLEVLVKCKNSLGGRT